MLGGRCASSPLVTLNGGLLGRIIALLTQYDDAIGLVRGKRACCILESAIERTTRAAMETLAPITSARTIAVLTERTAGDVQTISSRSPVAGLSWYPR